MEAVVLERVSKSFGDARAVDALDLVVPTGQIAGFIGPNGAGKTTTMRMILSILVPDSGALRVLGQPRATDCQDRIGYLPEERGLYKKMRVGAFLAYMARLKGVRDKDLRGNIERWLARLELEGAYGKRCEELSKGMQQKVQFAAAVLHEPDLLVLDEPFSGLDPVSGSVLRELVLEQHRAGRTILFSTHRMQEAQQLCDHVFMIHHGKKVLDTSCAALEASGDGRAILVELEGDAGVEALERLPAVENVARAGRALRLALREGADPAAVIREIAAAARVRRVEVVRASLEEIFLRLARTADHPGSDA